MSDQRDSFTETGSGHHNIVLNPDEKKVFGQLFQAADNESIGVVTGELAVKFFEKSGLSPRILGEIWGIADTENRGLLTKVGFSVALRLIGQAQSGQHPRPELAQQPGPLPHFEGVNISYPSPQTASSPPPPVISNQPTGPPPGAMTRVPPLTPQDVEKFALLFEKSGAVDGVLQGNIARDIFQGSRLPNTALIQIWNLADRLGRGALGVSEFVVAMHLINCCKNGSLSTLPQILPPGLYDAASGRPSTRNGPDRRQAPGRPIPPVPPISKQFSGPQAQRAQSPLSRNFTPPIPQNANAIQRDITGGGGSWAVTPADKQRFDAVFLTVDKANRGVITGEEAVPFFGNSKLPEDVLAQIWDLADINKAGQLNRDEFAIAMYLIVQQRNNPGVPLPDTLPPNLIPPSMRQQQRQLTGTPAAQIASPFDPPQAPPPPKSAADDLFGLDSFTSSVAQPHTQAGPAPSSGPFDNELFGNSKDATPSATPVTHSSTPGLFGRPVGAFVPTSSFGQSIMPSSTGGSNHSASRGFGQQQQKPQDMDDLLGDTDPEVSKNLTNDSTELAHLSNQIGSLTEQTQELNNKRVTAESDLTTLTTQKQNIEAQLAYLRTMYEQEAARVRQVEEQLAASRNDTAKVAQEYQLLEAEYNQLQHKHQEVSSQLEADKRENENLKEMMNQINSESRSLKEELERLNLLAKRERGMVAINKKQAEKGEQEREKLKNGIEEASRVTSPVPPASPTLSQSSNTNPFYRNKSPTALEYPSSPFGQVKQQAPPSMDDVFGSFSPTPPPPASFGRIAQDSNSYTPSLPESGNGGRSTPPTSPGPSSYHGSPQPSEAPAPAAGTQITSAFLPLPFNRAESMTSSTVANPTASVRDTEASRPDTPTNWAGSTAAETPIRERDAFVKAEDRRGSFSVKSDAGTEASGTGRTAFSPFDRRTESPFAQVERNITGTTSGGDENKPKLERVDSLREMGSVPGAFPGIEGAPIKAMATGESNKSNRRYDPFNSLNKDETRSNSSKDFEDAFRALGPAAEHHTGGSGSVSTSRFHDEFPPIVEVRPDSDSESEGGFEDNFTTTSPVQAQKSGTGALTSVPVEGSPAPPSVTAQQPPPAFNQDKSPYTSEFGGLLPSNTDSMKHDAPTPGGSTSAVIFPMPVNSTTAPVTIQDDFDDDAFGDLADAKEADDKSADDFGTSSAFDDFNPVFDSHPKSQNPGMSIDDDDDFAKFSFNIDQSQAHGESPIVPATTSSPQDWDAIFAGIGDPTKEANGTVDQSGMDSGEGGVSISDPTLTAINSAPVGAATTAEGGAIGIDDEKVTKLTGMGFDRENSLKALEKNGWDIDRAANSLIG